VPPHIEEVHDHDDPDHKKLEDDNFDHLDLKDKAEESDDHNDHKEEEKETGANEIDEFAQGALNQSKYVLEKMSIFYTQ
jgi:hypothetical protein